MNLLLLNPSDYIDDNHARISGRRFKHLQTVLKTQAGSTLKVGLLNGNIGTANIITVENNWADIRVCLDKPPPEPLPIKLILALPRPKMLKRIFQAIATLGVKELHLINSYRVEKSYWQTPWLSEPKILEQLILGLEQGVDTLLPKVKLHKLFKPFVEDQLPNLTIDTQALLAIPGNHPQCPSNINHQVTLVIGPEGGFIPYEVEKLFAAGCQPVSLGPRILKVETAVTALLAKLF